MGPGPPPLARTFNKLPDDSEALNKSLKKLPLPLGLPRLCLSYGAFLFMLSLDCGYPGLSPTCIPVLKYRMLPPHRSEFQLPLICAGWIPEIYLQFDPPKNITAHVQLSMALSKRRVRKFKVTKFRWHHLSPQIYSFPYLVVNHVRNLSASHSLPFPI